MVTSLIIILILFCLITYHKMLAGVAHARKADDYLSSLVATPEKLGNDIILMSALVNRDLPPVKINANLERRLTVEILLTLAANITLLVLTPILPPVGALAWTLTILGTIIVIIFNMNMGLIYINMKRNMWLISNLCNAYYDYKPEQAVDAVEDIKIIEDIIEGAGFTIIPLEDNKKTTDTSEGKNDEHE